jgi:outer membrane receptor protein involved in Fe transport
VVLASAIAAGQAARADEASASESGVGVLQEVVVTAQKREERLHDVPMGVSAITQSDLSNQRLLDFSDFQARIPGLSIVSTVPGQDQLTIRGQNATSVGATVATYVDDSPFGSSNALANGALLAGDFDTWDLARVEVLRGPQGTLYGASSEGGLFKYVTNAPDLTKFAAAVEAGGEDMAHGQAAGSIKGMVNVPVADTAALRVSGYYAQLPGYVDDPNLGEDHVNKGYRSGGRASFLWDITKDVSIRLSAFGQNLHTDGSPLVDVVGAMGNPANPPANQLQPQGGTFQQTRFINEPSDFRYRIYSGTLNWNFGFGTLTSITSYGTSEQDLHLDATWAQIAPGLTIGEIAESVTMVPTGVLETNDLNVKKWTEELRVASAPGTLEWQGGLFYTHESSTLLQHLPTFLIPSQADTGLPSLEDVSLDAIYKEIAAFAQFTYHFNEQFDLALGGRWSENKQSANETLGGLLVPPTDLTGDSTGTDFTYSIAPRFHFSKDTMAYGRIATGYRPGGPNALPPGTTDVPATYKSDSTKNYELGTRSNLWDNRLSVDVAAFLVHWNDIQLMERVSGFGVNVNGGTARSEGIEWTFALAPVTGLSLELTGAYIDAYLTSAAPLVGAVDGAPLPFVPKWSGTLSGTYTWHAFNDYNMFTGASWSYIGARTNDFSSVDGVTPNPRVELGGYNTVNLQLGLDNTRWTFLLWAKNIADSRGTLTYSNSNTVNLGGSVLWQEPRTVGATVTARF